MLETALKKSKLLVILLICSITAFAQQKNKTTISGYVKQSENGENIIGASVSIKENGSGASTNSYGFYSISVRPGSYTLVFQYLGFKTLEKKVTITSSTTLNINLEAEGKQINEVVVSSSGVKKNVTSMDMGVNKLEMRSLQKMPALMGEVDIVRSIQLLPGISTVGEGSSGFNVRGGGVDQNLILLDESPVYNSSHLFGFFSVFDPDAVKDVKLIKGGIPAMYGGRLSSILDVRMKDGNVNNFSTSGGIGTVSARFLAEAPIVKGKGSFVIAARRSYADMFLKLSPDESLNKNSAYFYDLSGKANYTINENNRLYLSGYFGKDNFGFAERFAMNWGNGTGTLRWNHTFNPSLFANFTAVYSNYDYSLGIPSGVNAFDWTSKIINQTIKGDLSYYANQNNKLSFGANATFYRFKPGSATTADQNTSFNDIALQTQLGQEYAAYVDNEQKITEKLSAQYGLRLSAFNYVSGQNNFTVNEYEGITGQRKEPVNPKTYNKGDVIKTYYNLEPRLSLRYVLTDESSVKASYNRTTQYLHLISNTTAATPLDVWQPTTNNIKPEWADQVALGYFRNFKNNSIEFSLEGFYKKMQNQIDYIDGAQLFLNSNLESELLYGNARAYGLEFYLKKNTGKLNGWISYTWSKSERQIDGINNDNYYPSKYDKTHNLSVVGIYDMSKRWSFSAIFTYSTGVSTTFPNGRYEIDGIVVPHNTTNSRNNYRIPSYNRLDISATLYPRHKPGSKYESNWVFSIYNLYARRNPYTIYFQPSENNPQVTEARRLSIIGSLIPSVTYNFNFR
ncbi:TonB-dependent receptor [Solitalea sp. MAHUQ-68]|uniref:TonB-dependent receptor n=1 Tax=Solitalea agri TaxID=2953739 RepID=A0A9X2F2L7_9SPHI|nr:TonB-dependent receptor [Solitalea agri]MCO4293014.1 TonB-dependent receptor [Solitalea agri]